MHLRPAGKIAGVAQQCKAGIRIQVQADGKSPVNGAAPLDITGLFLLQGNVFQITVEGESAEVVNDVRSQLLAALAEVHEEIEVID